MLETGLVIPGKNQKIEFNDIPQYLNFFSATLVRSAGSVHQDRIAQLYCDFVLRSPDPLSVPLLIPEYRYAGIAKAHVYRLDFLIINSYTLDKTGFELSPWSSHGYLSKTKQLSQIEINQMAQDNFEREIAKHRNFFNTHGIYTLIFSDSSLADPSRLFTEEFIPRLSPDAPEQDISFQVMMNYM